VPPLRRGLQHIGENYAQEAWAKYQQIGDAVTWHFIGRLQTNKAKLVVRFCRFVQSLDRFALAEELDKRAKQVGRIVECLVEVNIGGEATKGGVPPEEVASFLRQVSGVDQLAGRRADGDAAPISPTLKMSVPTFGRWRNCLSG
jgi:uncharacterized pyridoxal phosphate-containing UPF0001 family protein